ncbi:ABC transporter substrate-binding protein [Asanoa iriomotensis]|uniref:ABC transporter substrate-binding protein n=1 Tax=Asanoa iriomotensis TaxID=234613 RepID=A0ABQ4BU82_9ACTN|nr:sugar ABC transporter substrate-binding protein [Asanoa iriomotensis]GIF54091.1 ABC transporter substrate-binding protein [Asanoa iriomotensis]
MKRRAALRAMAVFAAMSVGLGLAACGSDTEQSGTADQADLVMSIWGSTNDTKTYQERADAYTATHPGVKVTVKNIPIENYDQQVDTMIAGGSSPDIILVDSTRGPALASRGAILDLAPRIQSAGLKLEDTVDANRISGYNLKGKQFALPDRGGNLVFYYNKTMFEKANVALPKAGWTWGEFTEAAKKLTIVEGGKTTQYGVAIDNWPQAVESVTRSFGGTILNDALDGPAIDSPQFRTGLQTYYDLAAKLKVSPTLQDYADFGQNVNRDALFAQGKTAMIWAGLWDIPDFVKQGLSFGIAPPPSPDAANPTMMAFGTGLAVGSRSKQQDAAWAVVQYMFSVDGQEPIVANQQDVPSAKALIPEWEKALPQGISYADLTKASNQVFSPARPPQANQIAKQVEQDLYPFFTGSASVEEATSNAASHIKATLAGS